MQLGACARHPGAHRAGRQAEQPPRLAAGQTVEHAGPDDGAQLWGETYSRELSDLLKLQEEMSREIADAPTIVPLASMTGDTRTETSMRLPSLRSRTVS